MTTFNPRDLKWRRLRNVASSGDTFSDEKIAAGYATQYRNRGMVVRVRRLANGRYALEALE